MIIWVFGDLHGVGLKASVLQFEERPEVVEPALEYLEKLGYVLLHKEDAE